METTDKITLLKNLLIKAISRLNSHPDHTYFLKESITESNFSVEITYNGKVIISETTNTESINDTYSAVEFFMLKLIGGDLIYRSHTTDIGRIKSVVATW